MKDLLIYLGAYLLGCIPTGSVLKKIKVGKKGSVWARRAVDFLKGAAAITLARAISPDDWPDWVLAGFLVLMGDEFPVFSKFKGVRGIGVTVGVFAALLFWMLVK